MRAALRLKRLIGRAARACFVRQKRAPASNIHWPPANVPAAQGPCARLADRPRRLAVCCFGRAQDAAEGYARHFLSALKPCVTRVIVACGAELPPDAQQQMADFADQVLICPNAPALPVLTTAALKQLGRAAWADYDELILLDGALYGPFSSLPALFDRMDARALDFWSLCSCAEQGENAFLDSRWLAVRGRMLKSAAFEAFFADVPPVQDAAFAAAFTRYFIALGYQGQSWLPACETISKSDDPMTDLAIELIRDYACPVAACSAFTADYDHFTSFTGQHTAAFLMAYLERKHAALADLIWQNLLHVMPMPDLVRNLALGEIIDADSAVDLPLPALRVAIVTVDQALLAGAYLPPEAAVVATLPEAENADLVCVPLAAPQEALPTRAFVGQVMQAFAQHPRLGVLYTPSGAYWARAGLTADTAAAHGYYAAPLYTAQAAAAEIVRLQNETRAQAHACFENGIGGRYPLMRDALARRRGESPLTARLRRLLNEWAQIGETDAKDLRHP